MTIISSIILAGLFIFLEPTMAAAHLVTTGMGPVYDGIGHLLLTPEDLIPVITIAVYAGLLGKAPGRLTFFILPSVWFLGGVAGFYFGGGSVAIVPAVSFITLGLLVAADFFLPLGLFSILLFTLGLVHGYSNGLALASGPGVYGLLGIASMLFVLLPLLSAFVITLKQPWSRIVVRISGSWVAAVGLLMFGWHIQGIS